MQNDSIRIEGNDIEIYYLAGFATAPHFMERLQMALTAKLQLTQPPHTNLLFPYGDWTRKAIAQLWEIRADMSRSLGRISKSIGGNRTLAAIQEQRSLSGGRKKATLFIGHSGGGVAAVHAAELLLEQDSDSICLVVMIGSPRCRIPERLRPFVLSISGMRRKMGAIASNKSSSDLVSRMGTYGGWQRGKHAPAAVRPVPIIGGHADYFRDSAPYLDQRGKSNLDFTLEVIYSWLNQWREVPFSIN